MTLFIIIFGVLICLAGLVILVNPKLVFGLLQKNADKIGLHIVAVVVRLVLGAFLIIQASASRFPHVIEIIGWLSIIAAIVLAVIGRSNFRRLMAWSLSKVKTLGHLGGLLAMVLGVFLVYAFV
ncbi:MAG: hypothetical protein GY732_20435 [Gammaproteobacteria bacterium]|nr:hypothetical protein [Gammaproteobacteria bacterium]